MTLRELVAAAKAKQKYDWDHTADMMAIIAWHKTGKPIAREHFHPTRYATATREESDPATIYQQLKAEEAKRA